MPRRALALLLAVGAAVGLAACSDEEPPQWLVDRATGTTQPGTPTTTAPPSTTVVDPGQDLAAADLEPGLCIEDADEITGAQVNEITRTRSIPCRLEHEAEVYLRTNLPGDASVEFPGVGELRREAQAACREGFEGFVGVRWTRSELEIAALWPSPQSWPYGDRAVVCVLFRLDGELLVGSVRGSRL
ncbi:MAG TPA: septum formation family protein [Acidimicrobiales bacterium]|nr:septum formation family protein [Acidimicrobiales bacterium]